MKGDREMSMKSGRIGMKRDFKDEASSKSNINPNISIKRSSSFYGKSSN